ncbi:MAG: hypothetical protein IKP76_01870 [Bacilli bacterium]|nr:hypothetical protein [Bacilli bacterium]
MRTLKKHLPEGVKKTFGIVKGHKVKLVSIDAYNEKKKKEQVKKAAKASK